MARPSIPQDLFRCDLCRRAVDADMLARARRAWQPLIICEACVRESDRPLAAVAAANAS